MLINFSMHQVLLFLMWPICIWSKSTRTFLRIINQSSKMGAPSINIISEWIYFKRWRNSLRKESNSIADCSPWLTFRAIDYLNKFLKQEHAVYEFGGGGSSLFFASRTARVITVEHDYRWFEKLSLLTAKYSGWVCFLCEPVLSECSECVDPSNPYDYASTDNAYLKHDFKKYAQSIDFYPDAFFDVVCVDGRARPSCLMHSIKKVKKGGLLVLDNAERKEYAQSMHLLSADFIPVLSSGGSQPYCRWATRTMIWRKNENSHN